MSRKKVYYQIVVRKSQKRTSKNFKLNTSALDRRTKQHIAAFFDEAKLLYNYALSQLLSGNGKVECNCSRVIRKKDNGQEEEVELKHLSRQMKESVLKQLEKECEKHPKSMQFKTNYNNITLNQPGITHSIEISNSGIHIQGIFHWFKAQGLISLIKKMSADFQLGNAHLIKDGEELSITLDFIYTQTYSDLEPVDKINENWVTVDNPEDVDNLPIPESRKKEIRQIFKFLPIGVE